MAGALVGGGLVAILTAALVPLRDELTRAGPALVLVLPVVAAGFVGGRRAAFVTSATAAAAFNLAFIPPFWSLQVSVVNDVVALSVFLVVGTAVGTVVAVEQERREEAEHRVAELQELHQRTLELKAVRHQLDEESGRLAVLERVDDQRSALLRSVSHDLRTPLATIQAVTSSIRDGTKYDDATREELLDLVSDEAERLDRIVANLLNLSRVEAGTLEPDRQAVSVDELIEACVCRLRRLVGVGRLQLDVRPDLPLADVDYSQIDQVLTNLLENAVRHTPEGSSIEVVARQRRGMIEVTVGDSGEGILPFERRVVFEPFRRGSASQSSGIGLAICRALVEANGGRIEVGQSPLGGAAFVFTMPVRRA
jgi:two-component system sensor histidine kinase KdpD